MSKLVNDYLTQALAIHRWLEQDRSTPQTARAARDRQLGLTIDSDSAPRKVLTWWSAVQAAPGAGETSPLPAIRCWLSAGLFCVALFIGGGLASLALTYEGHAPINVLALLGVLVGLPAVLLLITLLSAILRGLGLKPLAAGLHTFNFNRWALGLLDRYSHVQFGGAFGQRNAQGRLAFWQLTLFSQWFGSGFYIGMLLVFFALLTFTDLAFGWSSTLEIDTDSVHFWASWLATPWAMLWPEAVPDRALIEGSRIYRIELSASTLDASLLRGWWPFVMMTILTWGLLPRVLLLALAAWRMRVAARFYLLEHSEVVALLDRMSKPLLDPGRDANPGADTTGESTPTALAALPLKQPAIMTWNYTIDPSSLPAHQGEPIGLTSMQDEQQQQVALQRLAGLSEQADGVAIFTKGWEPPLLEFADLLTALRDELGDTTSVVVVPNGLPEAKLSASDRAIWEQFVARLHDPHTYVVAHEADLVEVQ